MSYGHPGEDRFEGAELLVLEKEVQPTVEVIRGRLEHGKGLAKETGQSDGAPGRG